MEGGWGGDEIAEADHAEGLRLWYRSGEWDLGLWYGWTRNDREWLDLESTTLEGRTFPRLRRAWWEQHAVP